ncbi:MAG: hypothetical protein LBS01_02300 [Prevotellaceae bacterium]|jgi:hypothetical protein|nr:hypothetical protein [Prevotellaceae bacterium]
MTIEQQTLAHRILGQFGLAKATCQQNVARILNERLKKIAENGVEQNGVTLTAAELQQFAGADYWAQIQQDMQYLQAFVNQTL